MRAGTTRAVLCIARNQQAGPMLAEASRHLALAWFEKGGEPPLLLKSNLISTVHRAVPLDLAVVPIIENGTIAGLSIHAGLWTSAALNAPPQNVPLMHKRLTALPAKFCFHPKGPTGTALTHELPTIHPATFPPYHPNS